MEIERAGGGGVCVCEREIETGNIRTRKYAHDSLGCLNQAPCYILSFLMSVQRET